MKRVSILAATLVLIVAWLAMTSLLIITTLLMSLDEEWQGFWREVLLDPYLMVPFSIFTGVIGSLVFLLLRMLRKERQRREGAWSQAEAASTGPTVRG